MRHRKQWAGHPEHTEEAGCYEKELHVRDGATVHTQQDVEAYQSIKKAKDGRHFVR